MNDLIFMGLLDLSVAQTENYKMKNSCPQLDWSAGPSASEAKSLSVALLDEVSIEY